MLKEKFDFHSQQPLPLHNSMWQQTTTPVQSVVTVRATFTGSQTIHILHLLCFSEAELDHDQGSAAVQLSSFSSLLMWLVLSSKKRHNLQVKKGSEWRLQSIKLSDLIPHWTLSHDYPCCFCLFYSPQLIHCSFYFTNVLYYLIPTSFPSSIFSLSSCSLHLALLSRLLLTLKHVEVPISVSVYKSQISLLIKCSLEKCFLLPFLVLFMPLYVYYVSCSMLLKSFISVIVRFSGVQIHLGFVN